MRRGFLYFVVFVILLIVLFASLLPVVWSMFCHFMEILSPPLHNIHIIALSLSHSLSSFILYCVFVSVRYLFPFLFFLHQSQNCLTVLLFYSISISKVFGGRFCSPTPNFCTLCPTFEKHFTGAKVQRKAQKIGVGCKTVYEIDPCWTKSSSFFLQQS